MTENVRLQNLRDFTVQIRRPADDAIVGTGVAVSMDGQVVTCAHYDQALCIARGITRRDVLIEARLAWGRWAARHRGDHASASGYRIYEADLRIALAWAHLGPLPPTGGAPRCASGGYARTGRGENIAAARAEAHRAQTMSTEMGYHWGLVDAAEVLAALEQV